MSVSKALFVVILSLYASNANELKNLRRLGSSDDSSISYNYVGSYKDKSNRALRYGPKLYGYTVETCAEACKGYKLFGLQNNGYCQCDNDFSHATKYGPSSNECRPLGGGWCNAIYAFTVNPNKPTARPTSKPKASWWKGPTKRPTLRPTFKPTLKPTARPTFTADGPIEPTNSPTSNPSNNPSESPTNSPTPAPTNAPTSDVACAETQTIVPNESSEDLTKFELEIDVTIPNDRIRIIIESTVAVEKILINNVEYKPIAFNKFIANGLPVGTFSLVVCFASDVTIPFSVSVLCEEITQSPTLKPTLNPTFDVACFEIQTVTPDPNGAVLNKFEVDLDVTAPNDRLTIEINSPITVEKIIINNVEYTPIAFNRFITSAIPLGTFTLVICFDADVTIPFDVSVFCDETTLAPTLKPTMRPTLLRL